MDDIEHTATKPIYSVLAHIYDTLMHDVDYELWADYIDELIQMHAPDAEHLLELACGTGSVALSLSELGYYNITATDASETMIEKARVKNSKAGSPVRFKTADFLNLNLSETYDLIFLIFDSINYLHSEEEILELHDEVRKVLKPGGLFIFDFTTPRNSRQAVRYLNNEEGISPDNYRFFRTSHFNAKDNIHTNEFEIEKLDTGRDRIEKTFVEVHQQKIYTFDQMAAMIKKTGFSVLEYYDDFRFEPANKNSLRITVVSQWQKTA